MEPIIILGQPRSGSSMTAGIFAEHGVWTGRCRRPANNNPKGFFENIKIKHIIMRWHKAIVHDGKLAKELPGFREQVLQALKDEAYIDGPWLWKGSAMYWPAFFEFKPQFIVVNRPREQIFKSCRQSHIFGDHLKADALYANIDFHQQQMDYLVEFKQAIRVNTFEITQGDFTSIRHALCVCGIEPQDDKIRDFVDPDLWHFK